MRMIANLVVLIMGLVVLFAVWDISKFIYGKFKALVKLCFSRKKKKVAVDNKEIIESTLSIKEQYGSVIENKGVI